MIVLLCPSNAPLIRSETYQNKCDVVIDLGMKCLEKLVIFAILLPVLTLMILYLQKVPSSPEKALEVFYAYNGAEDELMDPLILAGTEVIPLLREQIRDKNKPKRRYAIMALGHLGDSSSLPVLKQILTNASEISYFRCDALHAIAMINLEWGYSLAKKYLKGNITCLSEMSQKRLTGIPLEKRTWLEALFGRHK
jgi:hypothetical protein